MINLALTNTEFLQVRESVKANVQGLEDYVRWINDRPMLPERDLAIAQVNAEIDSFRNLQLKLYDVVKQHADISE